MNYRTIAAATAFLALAPLAALAENEPAVTAAGAPPPVRHPMVVGGRPFASTTPDAIRARVASTTLPKLTDKKLEQARERANQEIDRRIEALQKFTDRIGNAKRVSDDTKTGLDATMQQQMQHLEQLRTEIENGTSTSTIKDAVQSITKSYRIFALVIPQGAITAAADRVNTLVTQLTDFSTKLAARIASAQAAGKDVTALSTALTDMNAKMTDATAQAKAAVDEVKSLQPDNGDQTVLQANKTALQDAHKKIQAAQKDLQDARHSAQTIVQGLRALAKNAPTATTTP